MIFSSFFSKFLHRHASKKCNRFSQMLACCYFYLVIGIAGNFTLPKCHRIARQNIWFVTIRKPRKFCLKILNWLILLNNFNKKFKYRIFSFYFSKAKIKNCCVSGMRVRQKLSHAAGRKIIFFRYLAAIESQNLQVKIT